MQGKRKNSSFTVFKLFFVFLIAVGIYFVADMRMTPIINTLALSRAQNLATVIINDTVADMLSDGTYTFSDLVKIEYDQNGKISALTADSVRMNRLKSLISVSITKAIGEIEESKISIAMGTLTGSTLLTGRGPNINLNVHISCSCSIEVRNSFEYSGINQTMHKVMLDITTNVYVLSVGETLSSEVFTSIPISETVIIGQIPEIYAGKDDTLWQDLIN
ncbi:MAG: sporulation protein YunB [Clostridia bacterium]|nr:sporulation protein YunB [Clostridia bacterium]